MFSTAFRHLPLLPLIFISILQFVASLDPPYGKLSVKGTQLVGSDGQPVALHGMSLFWSQFPTGSGFYNKETVQTLKCKWNCNVVRAAMGIEVVSKELPWPGYLDNPTGEQAKVEAVVDAAIELGIYVIIDWHDHNAVLHPDAAVQFFANISAKYAKYPHIIYETYNEPQGIPTANQQGLPKYNWTQVKEYHERVVPAIRKNDPDNVIVLGTPTWSRDVDVASRDPLKGSNLMYTLHYYAATHKQWLRDKAQVALDNGLPLFVSEYGNLRDTGDGNVDYVSAQEWWVFLEQRNISYVDWTVEVGTNCLKVNSTTLDVPDSDLTEVGYLAKMKLRSLNNDVSCEMASSVTRCHPNQPPMSSSSSSSSSSHSSSSSMSGSGECC